MDLKGVFLKHDKPTLIKRVDGVITEEHWLHGTESAPSYDDMTPDRPFNLKLSLNDGSKIFYALTGSTRMPRYAQPFGNCSVTCVIHDEYFVEHWLQGRFRSGQYHLSTSTNEQKETMRITKKDNTIRIIASGYESNPQVVIQDNEWTVRTEEYLLWLHGSLTLPITKKSLKKLRFRWDPVSAGGFGLQYNDDRRLWLKGKWKFASIRRQDDLPTLVTKKGTNVWLDGNFIKGELYALYFRVKGPAVETYTKRQLWKRGFYPEPDVDTDVLLLPERITAITYPATYQFAGTCYYNAVINVLVCTPCLRFYIAKKLSLPATHGCAYFQLLLDFLYASICGGSAPLRPVQQSNKLIQLTKQSMGHKEFGFPLDAAIDISLVLRIPVKIIQIGFGQLRRRHFKDIPDATELILLEATQEKFVPRTITSSLGHTYYMVANTITKQLHVVTGLLDATHDPHIILDSNGFIEDTRWWPTVESKEWSSPEESLVWYVSHDIWTGRAARCDFPPPVVPLDQAACQALIDQRKELWYKFEDAMW